MHILPIIIAGGSGTRLWPLSRAKYPKQFLPLAEDGLTLLQATVKRLDGLSLGEPMLVCNEEHRFIAAEQMRFLGYGKSRLLLEPCGRNTAPAIALAALWAEKHAKSEDTVFLVLPADHIIKNVKAFHQSIKDALPLTRAGHLVTFGIKPQAAETGYGYIEFGAERGKGFGIKRFVEKPDKATAESYLKSGKFLWNSGMFMFKADKYLKELKKFAPDILSKCRLAVESGAEDSIFTHIDKTAFEACRSDSIDYAVMEKTADAVVVPLDAGWSDVGSWSALWDINQKDANDNVSSGDTILYDTKGTFAHSSSRLVAALGVKDLIIVETKDAVLVADKNSVQDVKKIVEKLQSSCRSEYDNHREVYRPWGFYDSIDTAERYQVKRITVKPGAKLSVQMHHHRAEHWIIVSGTAKITKGEETFVLSENQSTYIKVGEIHALENPGKIPLELIEVQSGSYLGEDDIVRFEDRYGRAKK